MITRRWFEDLSRADFLTSSGLYVMPDRLFLVRLRKTLLRVSVIGEEMREIPPAEDAAARRQATAEAVRSLLSHFDPAKEPLYICLSPDQTISLQFFLPQVAEGNLSEVLRYEVERQLPLRREEMYYDFLPLGKKGDKVGVFLFAVPKRSLDELLEVLSGSGVQTRAVETTATALSNYLLFCAEGVTGPAMVLGGEEQAWEVVGLNAKSNGWRQEPEILFNHWMPQAAWVQGPGREIFHNCMSESPKLFGWGYMQDFLLSMRQESLPVEDLLQLGKKRLGGDQVMAHSFFLPAVGAALRGLREASFTVNLLPSSREERGARALLWWNAGLGLLLVLGMIAWGSSYAIKDEIRLRQIQREIHKLAPSVDAAQREQEELNRLTKEISFIGAFKERRGEILYILDELSRVVPNSAYLSNLRYRDGSLELQGTAENASNLVPLLERSPVFENVGFNAPSNRGRDNRETFSLKATIERSAGKAEKR